MMHILQTPQLSVSVRSIYFNRGSCITKWQMKNISTHGKYCSLMYTTNKTVEKKIMIKARLEYYSENTYYNWLYLSMTISVKEFC